MWRRGLATLQNSGRTFLRVLSQPVNPRGGSGFYPPDFSSEDIETIRAVAPYTMTSVEKIYALIHAVEYVVHADIAGAVVECGVWKGGSMMAVARVLRRLGDTSRRSPSIRYLRWNDTTGGRRPHLSG